MHGSGNDFVLLDDRNGRFSEDLSPGAIQCLCRRKSGIGADGIVLIQISDAGDFKARFFNSDGSEADMCGNGGRCAARFARYMDAAPRHMTVETRAGLLHASILDGGRVRIQMPQPYGLVLDEELLVQQRLTRISSVNTGVPHAVLLVDDIEAMPVMTLGRSIRYHERFQPLGTNTNFVRVLQPDTLTIRTYERGVEDETLACGTGAVAAVLVCTKKGTVRPPVSVHTAGGENLTVDVVPDPASEFGHVFLEGNTAFVYSGRISVEAVPSMASLEAQGYGQDGRKR